MAPSRSHPYKANSCSSPNAFRKNDCSTRKPNSSRTLISSSSSASGLQCTDLLRPAKLEALPLPNRPYSSATVPSNKLRKNMKDLTGFHTTEDEFEALPLAVRRKYFSTLERLRLAERANTQALDDLPTQLLRKKSRRGVASFHELQQQPLSPRRPRRDSSSNTEASWFLNLPPKIKRKNFTAEERVMLDGRLQDKVILDAADEAVYRASRRVINPDDELLIPSPTLPDTPLAAESQAYMESFRWMDKENNLDLRLVLDDYHANIEGAVLPDSTSNQRPSFRRHMSITNLPFGRPSLSSSIQPRSPKGDSFSRSQTKPSQTRQRSRTLSLVTANNSPRSSPTASIDPNATHYQDPEARLKLRVYLASPQKFDEAIEFGFPSMDSFTTGDEKDNRAQTRTSRDGSDFKKSTATDGGRSFLDDTASLFEDDMSIADPDSPITPMAMEERFPPPHRASMYNSGSIGKSSKTSADCSQIGIIKPMVVKQADNYVHSTPGSREMTLRMTLTRPDLRADESKIYGWQMKPKVDTHHMSPTIEDLDEKFEIRGPFGGVDGWGPEEKEGKGLKRLWQRVKGKA
ncbi:hypothetical protein HYALB_00005768 [Hymenoscyphus albidus]|uniref:Mucin n=1 Tax=Hymenoscyphus albidus TaxID=595503 RepID=A0A9N9LKG5_9HELO|nr:hypothetical protein HYALB_00005768 [Hymenoscyphus albidus]